MDWALEHLDEPITVEHLAGHAHLGVRTLNRHFHTRVGTNPLAWLHNQRVRRAQELLERTGLTVHTVAQHCGFSTASALRKHFRTTLGTSPDAYREPSPSTRLMADQLPVTAARGRVRAMG